MLDEAKSVEEARHQEGITVRERLVEVLHGTDSVSELHQEGPCTKHHGVDSKFEDTLDVLSLDGVNCQENDASKIDQIVEVGDRVLNVVSVVGFKPIEEPCEQVEHS